MLPTSLNAAFLLFWLCLPFKLRRHLNNDVIAIPENTCVLPQGTPFRDYRWGQQLPWTPLHHIRYVPVYQQARNGTWSSLHQRSKRLNTERCPHDENKISVAQIIRRHG